MKKRIISLVLALTMILCFIPAGMVASATSSADWPSFRGNDTNNGVTSVATPRDASEATLKWAVKYSTGWSDAPSPMIIADDAMFVMYGNTLKKLSLEDGSVLKSVTMAAATSWGSTPPLYADGKIFCQLGGSTLQAFDATTMESLWVYTDEISGQAQSPVAYSDGKVYVGFGYNSESPFVCIDASTGAKVWRVTDTKGFYWAGAVVVGDYVIYGTETGTIYSRNKNTGALVTELSCTDSAKIRCTVTYDNGKLYWMLNDCTLCRADFNSETGAITNLAKSTLSAGQSTSTVAVHNGIVYTAGGKFKNYKVMAVDADTLEVKWESAQSGYPQCSMLVSTAYEASGYVYLYFTYNSNPGALYVIKAKADGTGTPESSTLYLPESAMQQYCICSVVGDNDGTLYYKNDSGYVFAVSLTEEADNSIKAVNEAKSKIAAIGNVTLASAADIESARAAYNALSDEEKALVTNAQDLTEAETKLEELKKENAANPINVYVTVSDKGNVAVMQKSVTVVDINGNGIFDVDDTLYAAHKAYYDGGVSAGYASSKSAYGLGITKLWGDTSGAFGYWLNNESCYSLEDAVTEGDHVVAFVYSDSTTYSDSYSKFDKFNYKTLTDTSLTLTLSNASYDANWNTVFSALSGATITVYDENGNKVTDNYKVTDNGDGTYGINFVKTGKYYVVATDNDIITVPAVCEILVENVPASSTEAVDTPHTSDASDAVFYAVFTFGTLACAAILFVKSKEKCAE